MNTHHLTALLSEEACARESHTITVWHASAHPNELKNFLDNGARPIGKGLGGQSDGFYVWNKKEEAVSHFSDFLSVDKGAGLLIGVTVDKQALTYPNWQFDVEEASALNPLFFKYKELIVSIKNLDYFDKDQKKTIKFIKPTPYATEQRFILHFRTSHGCRSVTIGDCATLGLAELQALIDKLCENTKFRQDYNHLLQTHITGSKRLALKYCGQKPLPVDKVVHIQKDAQGKIIETPLYSSSGGLKKQNTPFLKMGLINKQDSR